MTTVWVGSVILLIVIGGLTIWVTNKAYSKKWDE